MTDTTEAIEGEVLAEHEDAPGREVALRPAEPAVIARGEIGVADLLEQAAKIEQAMRQAMKPDVHYGVIPGTQKPTLLKPGAQKLCVLFRLAPSFRTDRDYHDDGHLTVSSTCTLTHIPTGLVVASGDGLCTTRESRYSSRTAKRKCPLCAVEQIRRSKNAPKSGDYEGADPSDPPGWYCWRKEGGCGANFRHDDPRITEQVEGKVANPDVADQWNTVLKMANKRALVDAVINGTAASDVFTQDMEDAPSSAPSQASQPAAAGTGQPSTERPDASQGTWAPPLDAAEMFRRLVEVFGGGEMAEETVRAFVGEAAEELYGVPEVGSIEPPDTRRLFLVGLGRVLRDLETVEGDLAFHKDGVRDLVCEAFKAHLSVALVGPPWRLDPSETTIDTYAEHQAALAQFVPAEQASDDIPFGEERA